MHNKIEISGKEIKELLKAWLAISFAFTLILLSPLVNKIQLNNILPYFGIALLTVGLGFLVHELGHKIVAQRYRCQAEFKADNKMLLLALAMSLFGFVFAAPGAVHIKGYITRTQQGLVSLAGPLMNVILALAFLPGLFIFSGMLGLLFSYGFIVNSWIGLFNLIPAGNFDGAKIYKWNRKVFYIMAGALLIMTIFGMFMQ